MGVVRSESYKPYRGPTESVFHRIILPLYSSTVELELELEYLPPLYKYGYYVIGLSLSLSLST